MNKHNKRRLLPSSAYLLVGLVFVATATLLFVGLWFVKIIITSVIENDAKVVETVNNWFPYVAGLVDVIITTLITAWIQSKIDIRLNAPKLLISCEHTKNYSISGIKKEKPMRLGPRITVGDEKSRYRIIYAKITNVGKGIMSECFINKQKIPVILEPGNSSKLFILLYFSNEEDSLSTSLRYDLPYKIQDANGNLYVGVYTMHVDLLNCQTKFLIKEKLIKEHSKE